MPKDLLGIFVLTTLYCLQGIPMGLFWGSMPFLLANKFSYSDQATFSLSSYPFSLKLLWSPIVDSIYFIDYGRRKSWIFPCQMLMGIILIYMSYNLNEWIYNDTPDVYSLTLWCFILIFVTATQDIAVDGWALTILSDENVSYQSTCQSFGQTLGYAIGFPVFLVLNSDEICSKYFGASQGIFNFI